MARLAAMDVGTHSLLMLVAEPDGQAGLRVIDDRASVTRLGEGLGRSGEIGRHAADRTLEALAQFLGVAAAHQAERVVAVGTMGLRVARDATAFLERVERALGLRIEVISGEEEARLTYLGVRTKLPVRSDRLTVFDVGGGSTEFVFGRKAGIEHRCSKEIGAVGLTERFLSSDPVVFGQLERLLDHLREEALAELKALPPVEELAGVGGTVTTLGAVHHGLARYDADRVHGTVLSREQINAQMRVYERLSVAERAQIPGLQPMRARVILAGTAIVSTVLELLGRESFTVSDRGLRHGLMAELLAGRFG